MMRDIAAFVQSNAVVIQRLSDYGQTIDNLIAVVRVYAGDAGVDHFIRRASKRALRDWLPAGSMSVH